MIDLKKRIGKRKITSTKKEIAAEAKIKNKKGKKTKVQKDKVLQHY